jgi:hypothetical protein
LKPPRSSRSTQTYKVPSEDGGEASVNVVRCGRVVTDRRDAGGGRFWPLYDTVWSKN